MARSNFPREDEHSKYQRLESRMVNIILAEYPVRDDVETEVVEGLFRRAFFAGWKAAMRAAIRMHAAAKDSSPARRNRKGNRAV